MRHNLFGLAVAGAMALAAAVGAQTPPQTQEPRTGQPTPRQQAQKVTVEGCLMREADVPGRSPNVAERAGLGEDYILTTVKIIKGSAPGGARAGETPTGTTGARETMYEVGGIDDEKLKELVGQRVQIEGTFEDDTTAPPRADTGTPTDDLVELRGISIRKVAGTCPVKQ